MEQRIHGSKAESGYHLCLSAHLHGNLHCMLGKILFSGETYDLDRKIGPRIATY